MGRALYTRAAVAVLAIGVACANGQQTQKLADGAADQKPHAYQTQTLQVELSNTIRANKAKVGDVVKARTVTALILAGQVVPEGSKVVGHVVEVSHGPGGQGAALAIAFDRFELKKKQTVRAAFSVRSGALPRPTAQQAAPDQSEQMDFPPAGAPAARPSAKAPPNAGGFTNSAKSKSPQQQAPEPVVSANVSGDTRGDLRAVPRGSLVGMPGVILTLDAKSGSGKFESANQKLQLKSGLQLMLGVDPVKTASGETGNSQQK